MEWSKRPLIFENNRITRSYVGGKLLNEWRGMTSQEDSHDCEELLVTSIGAICDGKTKNYAVSKTIEGKLLSDLIKENADGILGKKYNKDNPNNLSILARAGDTIVRLVMQCHPRKADAQKYFHELNGKAEAWYIARTRQIENEENCIYAGFKKGVTQEFWKKLIKKQDVSEMLNCLHKIPVKKGDVILIPAGMPHAVGPGCIFLEIHECSDITIRVEKNINGVNLSDIEMYNGLNEDDGLNIFDYSTYSEEEIRKMCIMSERKSEYYGNSRIMTVIDKENTDAFGMKLLYIEGELPLDSFDGHRVLIPTDGNIVISCDGNDYFVHQGWGCLLPAEIGKIVIKSESKTAKAVLGLPKEEV